MECPYCKVAISGITGLQEVQKFHIHLNTCKKHPKRYAAVGKHGDIFEMNPPTSLEEALQIRSDSGQ